MKYLSSDTLLHLKDLRWRKQIFLTVLEGVTWFVDMSVIDILVDKEIFLFFLKWNCDLFKIKVFNRFTSNFIPAYLTNRPKTMRNDSNYNDIYVNQVQVRLYICVYILLVEIFHYSYHLVNHKRFTIYNNLQHLKYHK